MHSFVALLSGCSYFTRFLLATLHLQAVLAEENARSIRKALRELTPSLTQTFEKTFERIQSQSRSRTALARRTLEWMFFAKRPLLVDELSDGLAVIPGDTAMDPDGRTPPHRLVGHCLGLVVINAESNTVHFVHQKVNEYLLSQLRTLFPGRGSEITCTCLTYLLFDEFQNRPRKSTWDIENGLQTYPFLRYATDYWAHHVRETGNSNGHQLVMKLLLNQNCLWNALRSSASQELSPDFNWELLHPMEFRLNPIQAAAWCGLNGCIEDLLASGIDVDATGFYSVSALHLAVTAGHEETASLLLRNHAQIEKLYDPGCYSHTALRLAAYGMS